MYADHGVNLFFLDRGLLLQDALPTESLAMLGDCTATSFALFLELDKSFCIPNDLLLI